MARKSKGEYVGVNVYSVVTVSLFSRSVGVGRCFHEKVDVRFRFFFAQHHLHQMIQRHYLLALPGILKQSVLLRVINV